MPETFNRALAYILSPKPPEPPLDPSATVTIIPIDRKVIEIAWAEEKPPQCLLDWHPEDDRLDHCWRNLHASGLLAGISDDKLVEYVTGLSESEYRQILADADMASRIATAKQVEARDAWAEAQPAFGVTLRGRTYVFAFKEFNAQGDEGLCMRPVT